jgi:hypothetical protein
MSVFNWLIEYHQRVQSEGDEDRQMMLETAHEASSCVRSDPARALAIYEQGRRLAEALKEPWWVMYFTHWKLQILLNYCPDFNEAQRLGVQATLEVRKPIYEGLPQRVCLHDDLVNSYIGSDPAGHAEAIREALAFMIADVAPGMECRYCIQGEFADFGLGIGALDEAEAACRQQLSMAEDEASASTRAHHSMTAYSRLCEIAFQRQDWHALQEYAVRGQSLNAESPRPQLLAEFILWQALLARKKGDHHQANRLMLRAESTVMRSRSTPRAAYFDALCAYHLEASEAEQALRVREREHGLINGKGMLLREALCWRDRCRLLAQLGRPLAEALSEARTAASRLRKPEVILEELARMGG